MHLYGFAVVLSDGVKCSAAELGKPLKLSQVVIVIGIDEGELSASKGDAADDFGAGFAVFVETSTRRKESAAGVEIGAFIVEEYAPPSAEAALPLLAYKERSVRVYYPNRKEAVIATNFRIFYCQFSIFHLFSSPTRSAYSIFNSQ